MGGEFTDSAFCFRLPELNLIAGAILTYVASVTPPHFKFLGLHFPGNARMLATARKFEKRLSEESMRGKRASHGSTPQQQCALGASTRSAMQREGAHEKPSFWEETWFPALSWRLRVSFVKH